MMPLGPRFNAWHITPKRQLWQNFREKYDAMEFTESNLREAQSDQRNFRLLDQYEAATNGQREHAKMVVEHWIKHYYMETDPPEVREGTIQISAQDVNSFDAKWQKSEVMTRVPDGFVQGTAVKFEEAREAMAKNPNFQKPVQWRHWNHGVRLRYIKYHNIDRTIALDWLGDTMS